jgi:hypothetical protein
MDVTSPFSSSWTGRGDQELASYPFPWDEISMCAAEKNIGVGEIVIFLVYIGNRPESR